MSELRLTGLVEGRDALSWEEIASLPGAVSDMAAVTDGAVGEAVPAAVVIEAAMPSDEAGYCTVVSSDGSYAASIPLADLRGGGWLAFRLGDDPLPEEHGGPVRLTVAEGRTLCWNVKDVGELRFTETKEPDDVPARPKH